MPLRVPSILTTADLPLAELHALRLDGVLVSVDRCFAAIDEIPGIDQRASALAEDTRDRMIAERSTAAWVWGALPSAPTPHEFCVGLAARVAHDPVPWRTVREVVIDLEDVVTVGRLAVTSPRRTIADLARFCPRWDETTAYVVRHLTDLGRVSEHELWSEFERYKLPHKNRALRRLGLR